MKIAMDWLRDYTKISVSDAEYESAMVMAGDGVEGMEELGRDIKGVVVGRVLTCENHPDSDHLHVCTVDAGTGEILQIVCGAPNVTAGILVPVATIGAELPGGFVIKKSKLRGVESQGMLCSSDELNIPVELYPSVGSAGLMILNEDYPLGTDIRDVVGLKGTVADFEILANRPDCLSVWGMARETAAVLGTDLTLPEITVKEVPGPGIDEYVSVTVEDSVLCPRYTARVIKNVKVGPSPLWLRQRLHASGMRSINNIVDVTNYVMLETGHPMHAFDLDKVKGRKVIVRLAKEGEPLTTLDGKEYVMTGRELAICDEQGPTGLAGIMGGEESEITEGTKTVMFECAAFDRTSIRLTARRFGFRTESSGRFERGVSPRTVGTAMDRACQLVDMLEAGETVPGVIDLYPAPLRDVTVTVPVDYINRRTGVTLTGEEMKAILDRLYFRTELDNDVLTVTAPEFRQDIEGKADISEEVLRLAGYDRIPSTALKGESLQGALNAKIERHQWLEDIFSGLGFYECMNYSFISRKNLEQLNLPADDPRLKPVVLRNPLGEDTACLRTTMLCGLMRSVGLNQRGGNAYGRLYEIGNRYDGVEKTDEGLPVERDTLAYAVWGPGEDFFSARVVAEAVLRRLGIAYTVENTDEAEYHPGRRCSLKARSGETLCVLGQVYPDVAENYDMDRATFLCEMDLDTVFALAREMEHVKVLSRFPAVERDLALVMDESVPLGPLMDAMRKKCGVCLEDIRLFDVFRGIQVGPGRKSAAFKMTFRHPEHTLTEEEIVTLTNKALEAAAAGGAALRL